MKKIPTILILIVFLSAFPVSGGRLKVNFTYDGQFGIYNIADTATAYFVDDKLGDIRIGFAKALNDIEKEGGPNHILISETQFDLNNNIVYEGYLEFRFGYNGGKLVRDESLWGTKRFTLFVSWPSGS